MWNFSSLKEKLFFLEIFGTISYSLPVLVLPFFFFFLKLYSSILVASFLWSIIIPNTSGASFS